MLLQQLFVKFLDDKQMANVLITESKSFINLLNGLQSCSPVAFRSLISIISMISSTPALDSYFPIISCHLYSLLDQDNEVDLIIAVIDVFKKMANVGLFHMYLISVIVNGVHQASSSNLNTDRIFSQIVRFLKHQEPMIRSRSLSFMICCSPSFDLKSSSFPFIQYKQELKEFILTLEDETDEEVCKASIGLIKVLAFQPTIFNVVQGAQVLQVLSSSNIRSIRLAASSMLYELVSNPIHTKLGVDLRAEDILEKLNSDSHGNDITDSFPDIHGTETTIGCY